MIPCDYCGKPDQAPDSNRWSVIMCDKCWQKARDKFMAEILSSVNDLLTDEDRERLTTEVHKKTQR